MSLKTVSCLTVVAAALAAATPAHATTFVYSTILAGAGEPVPTSTATGAAVVEFDNSTNAVTVLMSWAGLLGTAPFGHIHCCTTVAGTGNAGVSLGFTPLVNAQTGSYVSTFSLTGTAFNTLLTGVNDGKAYVNIHTPGTYSGGEIRGFLAPIPEPGSYAMLLSGLAVVGWLSRRQKRA